MGTGKNGSLDAALGIMKGKKKKKDDNGVAKKSNSKSAKAGLTFPAPRFQRTLKNESKRVSGDAGIALAAAAEYLTSEILQSAVDACTKRKKRRILPQDISQAVRSDWELHRLLRGFYTAQPETIKGVAAMVAHGPANVAKKKSKPAAHDD